MRLVVELAIVGLAVVFVLWRLHPSLLLTNTLPAGGDLSLHDWGPDALRREILPRISGWSWDWFDGFPAYQFYPVLPPAVAVGLAYLVPYGVAMKLVIVAGLVTLPVFSWLFARWWRLPFPAAPLMAVAALGFLFDTTNLAGGTIQGTIAGEYSFSFGLALAVLALGVFSFVVREGRWRAAAALVFAAAALSHPLTGVFVLSGVVAIVFVHFGAEWRQVLRRVAPPLAAGVAIGCVWWIPFLVDHAWMTDPAFSQLRGLHFLFPFGWAEPILIVLSLAGLLIGWWRGHRIVGALGLLALLYAVLFLVLPVGQFWNIRAVPFWSWCRLSLAAVGLAELLLLALSRWRLSIGIWRERVLLAVPVVALVVVLAAVSGTWQIPPFGGNRRSTPDYNIQVAFAGYQRNPQYPQYKALMDTMTHIGKTRGCGRFAWAVDTATTDYGTVDNALVPYWTGGCITSFRGLLFDSSATTPFINMTESLTSIEPERFAPGLPYQPFNMTEGVQHLRYAGVRYYAARTARVVAAANAEPDLVPIAKSGPWHIYEIKGSSLVTPLSEAPVVLAIPSASWSQTSADYTASEPQWTAVVLARTGPTTWSRLESTTLPLGKPLPRNAVSDVRLRDQGLSFHVDRTGVPVLVKASYFPGWSIRGGEGPYQVAGNMMVVIPTSKTVTMVQTIGTVGQLAYVIGFCGLGGVVALFVVDRRRRRQAHGTHPDGEPGVGKPEEAALLTR